MGKHRNQEKVNEYAVFHGSGDLYDSKKKNRMICDCISTHAELNLMFLFHFKCSQEIH